MAAAHLVFWMAEVLDLCLSELPNAQQPGAGSDLISVRLADLSSCKWQFPAVVVEEIPAQRRCDTHIQKLPKTVSSYLS